MHIDTRPVQWIGVALIVGWPALLAVGLPRVAAAIPSEVETQAGTPITVGGITITPVEGWSAPADVSSILVLRKQGTQLAAFPPQPATGDATAVLATATAPLAADTTTGWQIGDPQTFTTESGAEGVYAVALAPQQFIATYVVVSDGMSAQVTATGTDADWTALNEEILEMVTSLEISGGGS
jgi:hypothetical protein